MNYIIAFLTFRCQLSCSYCINKSGRLEEVDEMSKEGWIEGLSKIKSKLDLPITLGGGEPTMHPEFYPLVTALSKKGKCLDLLTNGQFDIEEFMSKVPPEVFKRGAPYPAIRVTLHPETHDPILLHKVRVLKQKGYEIGIVTLGHLRMNKRNETMRTICKIHEIFYKEKVFLSPYTGNFKYKDACSKLFTKSVLCKTSELLINPSGHIFRCHRDLYSAEHPVAHILDKHLKVENDFRPCNHYGYCNPCDINIKYNRFQQEGHCSVEIKAKKTETFTTQPYGR